MICHSDMGVRGTRPGMQKAVEPVKKKRQYNTDTHRELCLIVGKWLRKSGRIRPVSCPYVAIELVTASQETPDVFGWNYWASVLIEVKVSRSDFLADSKKPFRIEPESGIGDFRYYCCPKGMLIPDEMPPNWGLLYESDGCIEVVKEAEMQDANHYSERQILASIMRRESIKPKLFDYRNKNDEKV